MKKKMFAIASVTALAGLVAPIATGAISGCSSGGPSEAAAVIESTSRTTSAIHEGLSDTLSIDGVTVPVRVVEDSKKSVQVALGPDLGASVAAWIEAALDYKFVRKSGVVRAADFDLDTKKERAFHDALLTEITFPPCDASEKDSTYLGLKWAPELTRDLGHDKGGDDAGVGAPANAGQRLFSAGNFRLAVDKLPTDRVAKIDSLAAKMGVQTDAIGDGRDLDKEPGRACDGGASCNQLTLSRLRIAFPAADLPAWQAWYDYVVATKHPEDTKSGTLVYLDADRKTELLRLELSGLQIASLESRKAENDEPTAKASMRVGHIAVVCAACSPNRPNGQ